MRSGKALLAGEVCRDVLFSRQLNPGLLVTMATRKASAGAAHLQGTSGLIFQERFCVSPC